jgi:hypothetical protein
MRFALLRYPLTVGWVRHTVRVKEINRDVILAASAPEDESINDASGAVM